jgi:negative regulator of flagellin synthesis FlgM
MAADPTQEKTMKINDLTQTQTQRGESGKGTGKATNGDTARPEAGGSGGSPSDTVRISQTAVQLNAMQDRLSATPVVDGQRVQSIRASVQDGSYQIDPVRVADKLLKYESQL